MASGDRNYDIATETTQQEILSLLGSRSRSTKIHNGTVTSAKDKETVVFGFEGGGKVNRISVSINDSMGASSYFEIRVDGASLFKFVTSFTRSKLHFYRKYDGIALAESPSGNMLPLDIEFKENLSVVAYTTTNAPNMTYEVEISED